MRRGLAKNKKKEVKVVVAKGVHKGLKGRPKGVKGRYVMVDPRMRKEVSIFFVSLFIECYLMHHPQMRVKKRREKESKKRKRS
jgi:AdoMet-dependent rRNA methyltransferase SPB1